MNVPATLSLEDAARRAWPVVVVGAGPAGAVAASELARRGVAVLLVDRSAFPRDKVCGSCLNGRALAALAAAGLADLPRSEGAVPIECFRLAAGGRSVTLPMPAGVAVSRRAFDAALVRSAIARGAHFLPSTRATLADADGDHRRLISRQEGGLAEVRAGVVLAADGLCGTLRPGADIRTCRPGSRIGAGVVLDTAESFYRRGTVYMSCGRGGYVGLVRLEDGRLDVAAAVDPEAVRSAGGPGELAARLLDEAGWPVPDGLVGASWRGTPALTREARRVAEHRLFTLGDAAGYLEPFTGEGMAWALTSAVAVAALAARGWRPELAIAWTGKLRRLVRRRQLACRAAAFFLRRPAWTAAVVRLLGVMPALAGPVLWHLNHAERFGSMSLALRNSR